MRAARYDEQLAREAAVADAELKAELDAQAHKPARLVQDVPAALRAGAEPARRLTRAIPFTAAGISFLDCQHSDAVGGRFFFDACKITTARGSRLRRCARAAPGRAPRARFAELCAAPRRGPARRCADERDRRTRHAPSVRMLPAGFVPLLRH